MARRKSTGRKSTASKSGASTTKRKRRTRRKGMGSTTTALKNAAKSASGPLAAVGGLVLTKMANAQLEKVSALQPEVDAEGKEKNAFKKYLVPAAEVAIGAGVAVMAKNNIVKGVGVGMAVAGVDEAVAKTSKSGKGLLGLGNTDEVYSESKKELMRLVEQNSFTPAIPNAASPSTDYSAASGYDDYVDMTGAPL